MTLVYSKSFDVGAEAPMVFETGRWAPRADGSVVVRMGNSCVLCAVVYERTTQPKMDFLPFGVHYQTKAFAAGRIPGGYLKREAKPSDRDVLNARAIDRALRPLVHKNFFNDVQVTCSVLSFDPLYDPALLATAGSALALRFAGVPSIDLAAAVRVGKSREGETVVEWKTRAGHEEARAPLGLFVAGTLKTVVSIEGNAKEIAGPEFFSAVRKGHQALRPVLEGMKDFWETAKPAALAQASILDTKTLVSKVHVLSQDILKSIRDERTWSEEKRNLAVKKLKEDVFNDLALDNDDENLYNLAFRTAKASSMTAHLLEHNKRLDGRGFEEIRPIVCEVGVLPRSHGSAVFSRGNTQVLAALVLGGKEDAQSVEGVESDVREHVMVHYNFPSFSVGEVGRAGPPGRREIGHGRLALNAVLPVCPTFDAFPYSMRIVGEVLGSDGSSSQGTVCAAILSLMDAGVPITRPVAGIAMGALRQGDAWAVFSDLNEMEDALGCMDLKVAGSKVGVTAVQLDIKTLVPLDVLERAFFQALRGIDTILVEMDQVLKTPRAQLNLRVPQKGSVRIPRHKIRELIGQGGKVIRALCEETQTKIDISDSGEVTVVAANAKRIEHALERIAQIIGPIEDAAPEPQAQAPSAQADAQTSDKPAVVSQASSFSSKGRVVQISLPDAVEEKPVAKKTKTKQKTDVKPAPEAAQETVLEKPEQPKKRKKAETTPAEAPKKSEKKAEPKKSEPKKQAAKTTAPALKIGSVYPSTVVRANDDGLLVELHERRFLVPQHEVSKEKMSGIASLFRVGETIAVYVVDINSSGDPQLSVLRALSAQKKS